MNRFDIKKLYLNWKQFLSRPICRYKGHNWETYAVSTGYYSYDIEQAGYCKRCGHDTHGEYLR